MNAAEVKRGGPETPTGELRAAAARPAPPAAPARLGEVVTVAPGTSRHDALIAAVGAPAVQYAEWEDCPGAPLRVSVVTQAADYLFHESGESAFTLIARTNPARW